VFTLDQLQYLGLLASAHVFPSHNHFNWYSRQLHNRSSIHIYPHRHQFVGGLELQVALALPEIINVLKDTLPDAQIIVVGPHRALASISHELNNRLGVPVIRTWSWRINGAPEFLAPHAHIIDNTAIQISRAQLRPHQTRIPLHQWVEQLCAVFPELTTKAQRRLLIGSKNFGEYARMLGFDVLHNTTIRPENGRIRPTLSDFHSLFVELARGKSRCLFMLWTREMQIRYPYLTNAATREFMFGHHRFANIAQSLGLQRNNQWLHCHPGFKTFLNTTKEVIHHETYQAVNYSNSS